MSSLSEISTKYISYAKCSGEFKSGKIIGGNSARKKVMDKFRKGVLYRKIWGKLEVSYKSSNKKSLDPQKFLTNTYLMQNVVGNSNLEEKLGVIVLEKKLWTCFD